MPIGQPTSTEYREQLVGRAVDLVQLFPAAAYGKNAADIRLAVDAVEDMFRLPDLTHVVIVAGDLITSHWRSGANASAGTWLASGGGSSSRALAAACDDFVIYDSLPGVPPFEPSSSETERPSRTRKSSEPPPPDPQTAATELLRRALQISADKDDDEWLHNSAVKAQMKRMDLSFSEKSWVQVVQRLPEVTRRSGGAR